MDATSPQFIVVGRDERIDLSRYSVTIAGRVLIDYDKLRLEEPELYNQILKHEQQIDSH